jgi:hypothetical protein
MRCKILGFGLIMNAWEGTDLQDLVSFGGRICFCCLAWENSGAYVLL